MRFTRMFHVKIIPLFALSFGIGTFFLPCKGGATNISEETDVGTNSFSQSLNGDGDFPDAGPEKNHPWSWTIGYTFSKTSTDNSAGQPPVVDESTQLTSGISWNGRNEVDSGVDLSWAITPQENLTTAGASANLGYRWVFARADDDTDPDDDGNDDDDDFASSVKFKCTLGRKNYDQRFNGTNTRTTIRGAVTRPTTGANSIEDTSIAGSMKWQWLEGFHTDLEFSYDFYNRSVSDFQSFLSTPRALRTGAGGFSNTVGGLAQATTTVTVGLEFNDKIESIAQEIYSVSALDLSLSLSTRLTLVLHLTDSVQSTIGAEYQSSSTSYDTLGILGFDLKF